MEGFRRTVQGAKRVNSPGENNDLSFRAIHGGLIKSYTGEAAWIGRQ